MRDSEDLFSKLSLNLLVFFFAISFISLLQMIAAFSSELGLADCRK